MKGHTRTVATQFLCTTIVIFTACSSGPELDVMLHQSDQGSVYLQRFVDRSFRAAHPITINPDLISKVLRGILVQNQQGALQDLLAGRAEAVRVFPDDDVAYLAPLLAEGLSRAASDQQVGFRIRQTTGTSDGTTRRSFTDFNEGSIYAYGRSLYITLAQYHGPLDPAPASSLLGKGIPDTTGLVNRTIFFTPKSATRPESYRVSGSSAPTLVIDYDRLAAIPFNQVPAAPRDKATATPPTPAASGSSLPSQHGPSQQDAEIESLKKELQEIKRRLAEQEAERKNQPPKP